MPVNIDTVYQKVLALTSKEQRGYLTPQEFNLMADKAQGEIFDNYFHDIKTAFYKSKTDKTHADDMELVKEKIQPFNENSNIVQAINDPLLVLPTGVHFISTLQVTVNSNKVQVTEMYNKDILYTESNPLTKATINRPIYVRNSSNGLTLYPTPAAQTTYTLDYYKKPATPQWGYVVIKGRPLYNSGTGYSTDFSLHASEEESLVSRILQLAGVVIEKPGLIEVGAVERANTKQEQND